MKIVFVFDRSILDRGNIFYYLKELHFRRQVLVRFLLMTVVSILFFSHIKKKMAQQDLPVCPRDRLSHTAPQVLDSSPIVDLQFGRFFICSLMLFVFNAGRYQHLQSLLGAISKKLNKDFLFLVIY